MFGWASGLLHAVSGVKGASHLTLSSRSVVSTFPSHVWLQVQVQLVVTFTAFFPVVYMCVRRPVKATGLLEAVLGVGGPSHLISFSNSVPVVSTCELSVEVWGPRFAPHICSSWLLSMLFGGRGRGGGGFEGGWVAGGRVGRQGALSPHVLSAEQFLW